MTSGDSGRIGKSEMGGMLLLSEAMVVRHLSGLENVIAHGGQSLLMRQTVRGEHGGDESPDHGKACRKVLISIRRLPFQLHLPCHKRNRFLRQFFNSGLNHR